VVDHPADPPPAPGYGHSHGHGHGTPPPASRRARIVIAIVLVPVAIATAVAVLLLWPGDVAGRFPQANGPARASGTVTAVDEKPCANGDPADEAADPGGDGTGNDDKQPTDQPGTGGPGAGAANDRCGTVNVTVTGGPGKGDKVTTDIPQGPGAPQVEDGDDVVLVAAGTGGERRYQIIDEQRGTQLAIVVAAFALAVVAFGRWRGLAALAGLGLTFAVLLLFVVPAILDGSSPLLVAVVGAGAVMLTVLYVTHGLSVRTSVAVLGTLASLALTGGLAALSTAAAKLTGVAADDAGLIAVTFGGVDMRGLLLAGIIIGALGVLDDVATTQAATVDELHRADPSLGFGGLYRAAARVGRTHITSVVNTIVLAYAGASLPLLLLIAAGGQPLGQLLTSELLAEEVIRSAVGTLGLVAAVPITTALAALAARSGTEVAAAPRARHRSS
jgi:uncharacterized membrane protein